jgi:hypothetical protein
MIKRGMMMRNWIATAIVVLVWLGAGSVAAQEESDDGEAASSEEVVCEYHVDCPSDHVCRRGTCVESSEVMEEFSAEDACGADRRCRINRLKRRNRARRHARKLEEERHVEQMLEERNKEALTEVPRLDRPMVFDLRISRMGLLGLVGGYTLFGRLRPELQFVHWNADVSVDYEDTWYSGDQTLNFLMPGLFYFFGDSEYVPYLGTKFVYGWGSYSGQHARQPDSNGDFDSVDTEYHALELEGGVDYQMEEFGGHARLGLSYRPLIYSQARIKPGQYADATQGAMEKWFGQMMRIDIVFLAGWAF